MKLNDKEREVFGTRGLLYLRRFVVDDKTKRARDAIFEELARLGARANGKWHASKFPKTLRHQSQFEDVMPKGLESPLSDLAGRDVVRASPHPQLLLTPPQGGTWSVPYIGWHLDVASPSRPEVPGVQVFVLVDDVEPQGGATVAIAGSHALHSPTGRAPVSAHRALQADPLFAHLFSPAAVDRDRFLKPHVLNGVTVQVVEMCGKAGDAYLMDMRIVHAPALNASKRPRMVLTSRYLSINGQSQDEGLQ